jgi:hypothetical protein
VGGKLTKDVRFADDEGVVAGTEQGQKAMDGLNETAKKYDMKEMLERRTQWSIVSVRKKERLILPQPDKKLKRHPTILEQL